MRHSQLSIRYSRQILSGPITSPQDSYAFFLKIWDKQLLNLQEQVYILYLNHANEVICYRCLNTGTSGQTLFDIKMALACGLACMAANILIAHNHPSGTLKASTDDTALTRKLNAAAALMDIKLLDHIIMSCSGYFSFAENALI